jgi:FAD/FMN-containing dehydrogenase
VAGPVFHRGDPAFTAETAGFNTAVTHSPAVVVAAGNAGDVAAAVRYANDEGLPVAVQATGHGASAPADGTVFVSTKRMQGVRIDPVARVARVEAGVRWRKVIDAAVPHGLAPLSGSSSGVGVVGYTLGGGMGHLARRHGFAADLVRSIELVTADGEARTVTAESDPELFWAVRGGQGRFGIATALEFDLVPVPRFFGGALLFVGAAIAEVLHAFAAWAPTMPEEVTTSVALLRLPPVDDVPPPLRGVVSLALRFGLTGSPVRGEALLAPMRKVAAPILDSVGPMSYAAVDRIHMDPTEPMPAVMRGGLLHSAPADMLDTLLEVAGPHVEVPLAAVELRLMGGALGRPAEVPNAVAGREGTYSLSVVAPAPPPLLASAHAVTARVLDSLAPWSPGTSLVNFAGHGGASAQSRAWTPDTLQRLRRLKATVDPRNVFGGALTSPAVAPAGAR